LRLFNSERFNYRFQISQHKYFDLIQWRQAKPNQSLGDSENVRQIIEGTMVELLLKLRRQGQIQEISESLAEKLKAIAEVEIG
jgi:DNA-binding FadR family transcriptional regulator